MTTNQRELREPSFVLVLYCAVCVGGLLCPCLFGTDAGRAERRDAGIYGVCIDKYETSVTCVGLTCQPVWVSLGMCLTLPAFSSGRRFTYSLL